MSTDNLRTVGEGASELPLLSEGLSRAGADHAPASAAREVGGMTRARDTHRMAETATKIAGSVHGWPGGEAMRPHQGIAQWPPIEEWK